MRELAARLIDALVGVRAKVIALRLQQVRGQARGPVTVEERQRRAESRRRHAELDGTDDAASPGRLILQQCGGEELVEQQVFKLRVIVKGNLDLAKELAADDAAAAPHESDAAEVEIPLVLFRGLAQQHVALSVG